MNEHVERAAEAKKGSPFLTTLQAARYLGLADQTLEKMRREHRGPPYRRHGRYVRYHIAELDAWSKENGGRSGSTKPGGGNPPA
jgi:excisionase family DNA binding protein